MFQKLNKKEFKPSSPKFEDEWFPGRDDDDYDWDDWFKRKIIMGPARRVKSMGWTEYYM